MFNATVQSIYMLNIDRAIARYTSKNRLLTLYIENNESPVQFAKVRAAFNVLVEMMRLLLAFYMLRTRSST